MTKSDINKRYEENKLLKHPYKVCSCCNQEKHISEFDKKGKRRFSQCKKCRSEQYYREIEKNRDRANKYYQEHKEEVKVKQQERRKSNLPKEMIRSSKDRAKKKGLEFNIDESDIKIPKRCPVLGIPLFSGKGKPHKNSPTVDRIDSNKGYIKGNVIVVSFLANTIKTNATVDEIKKVAEFYEKLQQGRVCGGCGV